jgi:hypothetical protein
MRQRERGSLTNIEQNIIGTTTFGKQGKIAGRSPLPLFLFLALCSLISCRTTPLISDSLPKDSGFLPLDPGGVAYIIADVPNARPFLEQFDYIQTNDKYFRQMLDRTHSVAAAVYFPGNERHYQLVAWGRYPASSAKMALGASKDWQKLRSEEHGVPFWFSPTSRISIAVQQRELFVSVAAGDVPIEPFPSRRTEGNPPATVMGVAIPDGFGEFSMGSIASCWLENPATLINYQLQQLNIPIEIPAKQLFLKIALANDESTVAMRSDEEPHYTVSINIEVPNVSQARALIAMLTLARGFFSPDPAVEGSAMLGAILFSNPPKQDGKNLILGTNAMSASEIPLLFRLFSL